MNEVTRDMLLDLEAARRYSRDHGTIYAASNGKEIIWSDSPSQIEREGFWLAAIFENGKQVDL